MLEAVSGRGLETKTRHQQKWIWEGGDDLEKSLTLAKFAQEMAKTENRV
jgi:hypothetical protein